MEDWKKEFNTRLDILTNIIGKVTYSVLKTELDNIYKLVPYNVSVSLMRFDSLIKEAYKDDPEYNKDLAKRTFIIPINNEEVNWNWLENKIRERLTIPIGNLSDKDMENLTINYAVYEKEPAHGSEVNGVILGPYKTKEEAEVSRVKYGYNNDNYYIDTYNII
jgi:hypothetical protein